MSLLRNATKCLANQEKHATLNAFLHLAQDGAGIRKAAQEADERAFLGKSRSIIDGRLIAIKDNIVTKDEPTTCASNILSGFTSPFAATIVEKLKGAGAIIAGKTNLDEFGMGSHSTQSAFGFVLSHKGSLSDPISAGGSSGGSAVAVATEQCWAAIGTDTGGSVRLPAAYTGIVGFKPSYGLISRHGVVAYANSLDTVGILAPNSRVAEEVFRILQGFDKRDPTSLSVTSRTRIQESIPGDIEDRPLRIGVPLEYSISELDPLVRAAWLKTLQSLSARGHSIISVSLPATKLALSVYYIIAPAEASSNLAKYDGIRYGRPASESPKPGNVLFATTRGEGFGEEVKRRILLGSYSLSASAMDNYFIKAQKIRRLVQRDFDKAFAFQNPLLDHFVENDRATTGVDVLLAPTAPSTPPMLSTLAARSPIDSYRDDVLTVPASLAGLPAISVPVPLEATESDQTPHGVDSIGLQITAQYGHDEMVLRAARIIEGLRSE